MVDITPYVYLPDRIAFALNKRLNELVLLTYVPISGASCAPVGGGMLQCTSGQRLTKSGGITLGSIYVTSDESVDPGLLEHERVHSVQWALLGPGNFVGIWALGSASSPALEHFWPTPGCNNVSACHSPVEVWADLDKGGYIDD